jgi:nucleotide-binding universal stress UspA family protein
VTYDDTVIVAIDENDPDRMLLGWAAAEATARSRRLVVCHVCEWQPGQSRPRPVVATGDPAGRFGADRVVAAAVDAVRAEHPGVPVRGVVGIGRPARTLVALSEEAAMIVVGARGLGGFAGLLMGTVSGQVAEHALCPVAVVRPVPASATDVVVGIDGSDHSGLALALGLAQARRAGGTLIAVHALRLPPGAGAAAPNPGVDLDDHRKMAEQALDEALGDLEARGTDVPIERRVVPGPPARVLIEAARDAAAMVVGARGVGGFAGLVAGSVSQQVLRHAHCPVLVAH